MKKKQKVRFNIRIVILIAAFVLVLSLVNQLHTERIVETNENTYLCEKKAKKKNQSITCPQDECLKKIGPIVPDYVVLNPIDDHELELYAHVIYGEAGNMNDECQQAVGMVVKNRVNSDRFPDTTEEVIFQPGQYACTWKGGTYYWEPSEQAYENAKKVILGETDIDVPSDVVFQAQFTQGSGVWRMIGNQYFCHL